jgi:hypothetical protein
MGRDIVVTIIFASWNYCNYSTCCIILVATGVCFPIRICTVTADATNGCGENIGLAKLFLALIQARETPRVLVRVIVSKELVVRDKIPPSPVLVSRHASGRARTE